MGDIDLISYSHWARNLRGLAETTIRVRLEILERLTAYVGVPLRDIEPGHILRFERAAIAGRAPETRRAYACHLRSFFAWAKAAGIVSESPAEVLTLPSVPRHLPRPIEEEDLAFALAEAKPKMAAMLTLAGWAGLRSCEIAGLEWNDLRREQDGTVFLHVRHGKGHKERSVEVGQVVLRALHRYGVKRRGAMFYGADGQPINARSVSSSANRYLARHGIDATMHQLRHRFGTVAYQLTQDLRLVQELLGHASPQTTAGYTRTASQASGRLVAALDKLADIPSPRVPDHGVPAAP